MKKRRQKRTNEVWKKYAKKSLKRKKHFTKRSNKRNVTIIINL